jgi:hypothetical protein
MEDFLYWISWLAIIGGIASSINKAKKRRELAERKATRSGSQPVKPAGGAFGELIRRLSEIDDDDVLSVPKPVVRPAPQPVLQPVEQSYEDEEWDSPDDEFDSLEGEWGSAGGEFGSPGGEFGSRGGEWGSPGGEFGSRGGEWGSTGGEFGSPGGELHHGGTKGSAVRADRFEAEIAAYEKLARQRSNRHTIEAPADPVAVEPPATHRLQELLDGEFDLRRAIIESEILTPKYKAA